MTTNGDGDNAYVMNGQVDLIAAFTQQQHKQQPMSPEVSDDPNLNAAAVMRNQQRPRQVGRQASRGTPAHGPWVEIVEQPKARGLRFRYECEGRSAGSIPGDTSTPERKTFPSIKIHNYNGPAVIVVSCVTKDAPHKPHPHNLVGKDCKKGVCTLRIRDTSTVSFPHLGIQCAKKKDVEANLKLRQDINVDPFQTGFKHKGQNIDLNVVRLCFQVFLPDEQGKITRIVTPQVSQSIHDKKALNDLVICRVDRTSGKCKGGDEVFLLCEKINRDDIRVRFYEERDGKVMWEAFGDFGQNDVHRQFAIVFKTPPFRNTCLQEPTEVYMQLQRNSDLEGSDPIQFTYQPEDPDPDRIVEKRKRKAAPLNILTEGNGTVTGETLRARLKLKATRTSAATRAKLDTTAIKEEVRSPEMPQYSMTNINPPVSMTVPTASLLGGTVSIQDLDLQQTTIASQASLSGGNVQYIPVTSHQVTQPPPLAQPLVQSTNPTSGLPLNQHTLQMLAQTGVFNPQQPNQTVQPDVQQQQNELLKQILHVLTNQQAQQQPVAQPAPTMPVSSTDPNMQSADMPSLGSLDQNFIMQNLMQGESPMASLAFSSFDGLSGNDLDCDPNVAGFETVGDSNTNE